MAQASRCVGLESTMTPSMSKTSAIPDWMIMLRVQFRLEPVQIVRGPLDNGNSHDFGRLVGVGLFQLDTQAVEPLAGRFDHQQTFVRLLDGPLPSIEAAYAGNHVHASSQTLVNQLAGDPAGLFGCRTSAEDDYFVGHVKKI